MVPLAGQPTSTSSHADNPSLTSGQLLYRQASQSAHPDMLVKGRFEQSPQGAKARLADEFVSGANYTAMTGGVLYGLAENAVLGLAGTVEAVCKESGKLKGVDNLEYAAIDDYGKESNEPGLSLPSLEDVATNLKQHLQATSQQIKAAKDEGDFFAAGKAMSNDPMLQMTGLGDVSALGVLNKMRVAAKLENLDPNNARMSGTATHGPVAEGGHVSGPDGSSTQVGSVEPIKIRYVDMPNDLVADAKGVYGYLPTPDSQFHSSKWPVDWSDVDQVSAARTKRLDYHVGLEKKHEFVEALRMEGVSDDHIARYIVEMRNQDRLSHYKTPEALEVVYKRNLANYGNTTGPTYDSQLAKYGTSTEVINAALRTNDSMDILTGIAKPK
jgi:hypothetical protein